MFSVNVMENDSLMSEELFGPILPVVTVNSKEEALKFIKSRFGIFNHNWLNSN